MRIRRFRSKPSTLIALLALIVVNLVVVSQLISLTTSYTTPILASGLTTNRDDQPGQVRVQRDGEQLHLTTEVVDSPHKGETEATKLDQIIDESDKTTTDPTTVSAETKRPALGTRAGLTGAGFRLPTGFAQDIGSLINAVMTIVIMIAALLVFLYLIWGAIDWITSGGERSRTEAARSKIIAALVGLIIVASSFAVLTLALRFLGFESLNAVFENVRTLGSNHGL